MKCNLKRVVLGKNLGTTAKNSKFYSKWAVSLCSPPLYIEIECSFVKLVINGPCVRAFPSRWVLGKINIFDMLDWFTFSLRKKGSISKWFISPWRKFLINSQERACWKKLVNLFFPKLCLHCIYHDNLLMWNESTFVS